MGDPKNQSGIQPVESKLATEKSAVNGDATITEPELSLEPGSKVWVWDSTWLPAVVVFFFRMDCVSVQLEHGVIFSVGVTNLAARDPARRGRDVPPCHR
jgi:hypothetical protein